MAKFNMYLLLSTMISIMAKGVVLGDIEVFVNDSVSMKCSPNGPIDIQWHHNSVFNYVYAGRKLRPPYNRRFLLKKDETTGEYDLIIPNVILEDAGLYHCSEEMSGRRINSTQLTVLYMKPVCSSNMPTDGFIGPNTCNIQTENMMFTCDVIFNGSAPHLSWRSANDSKVFNSSSCEVNSNRGNCSLALRADPFYDGSVFRCDVGQTNMDDRRYSCYTERIKVQYFFGDHAQEEKHLHENASCVVRSNLNVRYNWTIKQDNDKIFLTSKQTVSIEKPGLHQCEVKYSIRNVTCSTLVSVVNATEAIKRTDAQKEQSTTSLVVILTMALVSVITLIGSVIYILKLRRRRTEGKGDYCAVNLNEPSREIEMSPTVNENYNLDKGYYLVNLNETSRETEMSGTVNESDNLGVKENSPVRVDEPLIEKKISAIENNREILHVERLNMESQKDRLVELIESEFGLLDKLLSCDALTKVKIAEVKSGTTLYKKNEFLLNEIFSGNKHQDLMKALLDCGQHHVVNWVKGNGRYKEEFGVDWPLRETEDKTLNCNQEALVDLLNADEILPKLYALGVFNKRQKNSIGSKPTEHERSEALLDAVRRFSLKSYLTFKECLRQSDQSDFADILENGGIIVPVHATQECENLDEVETRIVNEMENVLRGNASAERANRVVAALQLRVIAMRRGQSIVSFISCIKEEQFIHLCKIVDNLEMRNILEQLFNLLIPNVKIKVIFVDIFSKDKDKAKQTFIDMKSSWTTKISDLSLELIDMILEKSYLVSIQRQKTSLQNRKDEVVIKVLASVDFCWFQRITRRRFKNVVWSKMKKHYEDKCKLYLICKSNQQFFEDIHQMSGKTRTTLSTDHLSNSESTNLKGNRSLKKQHKVDLMLRDAYLAPENEESVVEDFISSYDPKEQELIREIMKTGGGSARVEIKLSRPLTKFELIPQQFEDKEMKILRSLADRDAVVWIWCHSSNALQKLNNRDGLKTLIEIVHQTLKGTSDVLENKNNIDCDHLEKKIVSIPLIFADFRTTLNFYGKHLSENRSSDSVLCKVIDVTKLKMKVYVLCLIRNGDHAGNSSVSTMICVFRDRSPYPIVEELLLKRIDITEFRSIVSSVNCLYLLAKRVEEDHKVDEVMQVEIKENEEHCLEHPSNWLKLEIKYRPSVLSISKDGYLMMVSRSSPNTLRIYNSDARLRLSVKLHEDILKTRKAVETSYGNFIILHSMKQQTEDVDDGDRAKETNEDDSIEEGAVSEVSRNGKTIIRRFIPQNEEQQLTSRLFFYGGDLCTDSEGRVFVADTNSHRVIVLNSYLRWIGSLIIGVENGDENEKFRWPSKLFYDKDSHEMIFLGKDFNAREEDKVRIYGLIFK